MIEFEGFLASFVSRMCTPGPGSLRRGGSQSENSSKNHAKHGGRRKGVGGGDLLDPHLFAPKKSVGTEERAGSSRRNVMSRHSLLLVAIMLTTRLAVAQAPQLSVLDSIPSGASVCGVGDVDGDGYDDYVRSNPWHGFAVGQVTCFSGNTGAVIWTTLGTAAGELFGTDIKPIADTNGDGRTDIIAGAPGHDGGGVNAGACYILSGTDGTEIHLQTFGTSNQWMGTTVTGLGDVDGDGLPEFAMGSPVADFAPVGPGVPDRGLVAIYSINAGSIEFIFGGAAGDMLGHSIDDAGSFEGNGFSHLVIGIPFGGTGMSLDDGEVRVYRVTATMADLVYSRIGGDNNCQYGFAVAGVGDTDGDGLDDILAGAPDWNLNGIDTGVVQLIRGGTHTTRSHSSTTDQDRRGTSVTGLGDVDGDGRADYAIGAIENFAGGEGHVTVVSGRSGGQIAYRDGAVPDGEYGAFVRGVGDVNGDGIADVAVGSGVTAGFDILGLAWTYPGSNEDLVLKTATDSPSVTSWPDVKYASDGDAVTLEMTSPNGSYIGTTPVLLAQPFVTGNLPVQPMGFPEAHVSPGDFAVLFSGYWAPYFGPSLLTEYGVELGFVIPPGLAGQSVMIQGACIAPSAKQSNPFFTATAAHELRF